MKVEEEYTDILQNLEFIIVTAYRDHSELTDSQVSRTLDALSDVYIAEGIHRPPRNFNLSELEQELHSRLNAMCEWRLGRAPMPIEDENDLPADTPIDREELLLCIDRIRKSVRKWNKSNGIRGYLDFIKNYV